MLRRRVPAGAAFRPCLQGHAPRLILCALATLALLLWADCPAEAATAVGAIAGSFAATPTGGAAYTIPLPAPGGAGGLSPSLSIDYASGSGPGLLGWDMTVGGLSAIKRCPSTWPYDGSTAPVNLTSRDRFCLGGQELTLKSGTYGDDGAVYLTTPTSHMEEISHTSNNATGPQWFQVLHPDGSVWEYGHTADSEVTATNAGGQTVGRVWALDKITDASGNTITFHYTQPSGTGAYYLTEVDWGANVSAGTGADHKYVFSYATVGADATRYRYLVGHLITWNERLSKITLEYNGATTLSWTPSYVADGQGSNRSRLTSIQECDGNSNCLPETHFRWQQGTPGYDAASNTGEPFTTSGYAFVEDVNGDGREDLVYDCGGDWCVRFGQAAGGFGAAHNTGVGVVDGGWAQPIHYQPGAGDQILVDDGGTWTILAWNGSGFTPTNTGIAVTGAAAAVDVNGDGYDDLVTYSGSGLIVHLNTTLTQGNPGQGSSRFGSARTAYSLSAGSFFVGFRANGATAAREPTRALHFTHTPEAGLIARVEHHVKECITDGCRRYRYFTSFHDQAYVWSNGALAPYGASFAMDPASAEAGGAVVPLDVNGDGLTDLVLSGTATLLLNTGSGFTSTAYGYSTSGLTLTSAVAVDYTGNGRDDLLVPSTTTGDWMRLASTGTGFSAPVDTGIASGRFGAHPVVADSAGRMLADLVGVNGAGDIELALRHGPYPDQVTKITDGFGNTDTLAWEPLSAGAVSATYPVYSAFELDRRGRYLLASERKNDGIGGSYTVSYHYDTPVTQAGAGFAGINQVTATDSRNGTTTTRVYAINTFALGYPKSITVAQGNGDAIHKDEYTYSLKGILQKNRPALLYKLTSTQYGATQNPLYTAQRVYAYDSYYEANDVKTTTTDTASGKQWVSERVRTNDESTATGKYCLDLASAVTVTDTVPGGASATRATDYTPDLPHCRYSAKTLDANLAVALQTHVSYVFDTFGNRKQRTVTGHTPGGSAMSARVTHYAYDPHGEFRTQTSDAVGDVTHAAWDAALGVKTSTTAANGAVTHFTSDGFGRLTQTTLPTGAGSTVSYHACSGSQCNAWAYYTLTQTSAAGGSAAGERYAYYDRYGRLHERAVERPGGGLAYAITRYNALGQVAQQSAPYYSGGSVYWTTHTYDALGRPHTVKTPLTGGGTAPTTYTYSGLDTTVAGPNGFSKSLHRNPLGEITAVTNADGNTSHYTYAPFAELTQVTGVDGARTVLTYDAAGHRTRLAGPDRGTLHFHMNSFGAPVSETNARGQAINFTYNALGRLTQRSFPNPDGSGSETQHWSYATSGNGAGRLASESDNATSFNRTPGNYNTLGEPTTIQETYNGIVKQLTLAYDSLGRITSITYPVSVGGHALQVNYHYDASGTLESVSNANTGTVYWQLQSGAGFPPVNALGEIEATTLGGGLDVERLHDAATGAVTSITSGPSGSGSVLNLTSSYNESGSRATLNDLNAGLDESYRYDHFQRLTGVTRSGSGSGSESYTYGAAGQFNQGPAGTYGYAGFPAHSPASIGAGTSYNYDYNAAGERTAWTTPAADLAPVAVASASPPTLTGAGTVTLDGTGSYDPDRGPGPLTYQWSVVSEPAGASVQISGARAATASVAIARAGTYTFRLTVSDGQKIATKQVTVTANILPAAPATPTLSPNPSASGSYTVAWTGEANTTSYRLEQSTNGGSTWGPVYSGGATAWSASAKTNGHYAYRVRACNGAGCSAWSAAATETVAIPPGTPGAPTLSPNPSDTGSYSVAWTGVAGATGYDLDQSTNGGSTWGQVYSGGATSWSPASAKGNGRYTYKVRACDSAACSGFGATATEHVYLAPGAPSLSPSYKSVTPGESYTISWTAPSGQTTHYQLEESSASGFGGATPADVGLATSASYTAPPTNTDKDFYYRVRACNHPVCGTWSNTARIFDVAPSGGGGPGGGTQPRTATPATTRSGPAGADPTATWNALGEAHTIQTADNGTLSLTYGPDGGLINATGPGGGRYLGAFVKETDANDWAARILVNGRVIAVVKDTGGSVATRYLLQGPLGSTRAVATGSGTLTTRIAYSAWGAFVNPATGTGSVAATTIAETTTVTYTGHELIAGAGLINMGARLYDPATGLFMSPDPTVAAPYDTQDLNQYAYVGDNPMSYVDPDGYSQSCDSSGCGVTCFQSGGGGAGCAPCLTCIGNSLAAGELGLFAEGGRFDPRGNNGGGFRGPERPVLKLKLPKLCFGAARSLGNPNPPSGSGAFGVPESLNTANVAPRQFTEPGMQNPNTASVTNLQVNNAFAPFRTEIFGTISGIASGTLGITFQSFTSVTDVIGNQIVPKGFSNIRQFLEHKNPGDLLIEINGGRNLSAAFISFIVPPEVSVLASNISCTTLGSSSAGGGGQ